MTIAATMCSAPVAQALTIYLRIFAENERSAMNIAMNVAINVEGTFGGNVAGYDQVFPDS